MGDAAEVRLVLNAIDNASKVIGGVSGSLSGLQKAMKGGQDFAAGLGINLSALSNPAMAAGQGVKMVADYVRGAVTDTNAYNLQIKALSESYGVLPEEISRVIQTGDDFGVTSAAMEGAFKRMAKEGIPPTVDGLAKLADRLNAIQDPQQRAAKMADIFGKSWTTINPLIVRGGEAIREYAASQSDALVVTQAEIDASERMRVAQDAFNDTLEGFKMQVGNAFIPAATDMLSGWNAMMGGTQQLVSAMNEHDAALQRSRMSMEERQRLSDAEFWASAGDEVQGYQRAMTETATATTAVAKSNQELADIGSYVRDMYVDTSKAMDEYMANFAADSAMQVTSTSEIAAALNGPLAGAYSQYTTSLDTITEKNKELQDTYDKMISQGYNPQSEKMRDLKEQIDETAAATENLNASYSTQVDKMMQSSAMAGLNTQQQLELGRAMGWVSESDYQFQSALESLNAAYQSGGINMASYTNSLGMLKDAASDGVVTAQEVAQVLDSLDGRVVAAVVKVITQYEGGGGGVSANMPGFTGKQPVTNGNVPMLAGGGDFIVPPGFSEPGNPYMIGTSSGERVTVTPNGQSGGSGTPSISIGGVNVYAQPGQDGAQLARQMYQEFTRLAREQQTSGAGYAGRG